MVVMTSEVEWPKNIRKYLHCRPHVHKELQIACDFVVSVHLFRKRGYESCIEKQHYQ